VPAARKVATTYTPLAEKQGIPTCKPAPNFSPEKDAEALYEVVNKSKSKDAIINVIAYRSTAQRQEIRTIYKQMYGRDLIEELDNVLGGTFQRIVMASMRDEAERDAHILYKAMKGVGYDEETLLEILISREGAQIEAIGRFYFGTYGISLEDAILSEASGQIQKLLVGLAQGNRTPYETKVDVLKCRKDAQVLLDGGEKSWGTEKSQFRKILCVRSIPQLNCIFQEYSKICKYTIGESIKREMSGHLKKGCEYIVKYAQDPHEFFAGVLYKSMKGMGTNDRKLTRTVVTRCEVDMFELKDAFLRLYGKTVGDMITGDCSGSYRRILLILCGEPN